MGRNEKDLLSALLNVLPGKNDNKENKNNDKSQLIEKYRDKDGFINLKNVNDINEITKIFNIVDKKNMLELLEKNNLQDLANTIAKNIKDVSGDSIVNVQIKTPFREAYAKVEMPNETNVKLTPESHSEDVAATLDTPVEIVCSGGPVERTIVLYDAGGMYNAPFYNAVLHICETQHFKQAVYRDNEIDENDNVNVHVLLPNIWGKIYADIADEFSNYIKANEDVYIIDPETFELIKINNSLELWDYAMTLTQEEML